MFKLLFVVLFFSFQVSAYDYPREYQKEEIVFGNQNAPLQLREIFSLTCSHCANASVKIIEPLMASDMFKEGKIMLIFDPFPLDPVAAIEQQLVSCVANRKEAFMLMKVFYKEQNKLFKTGKALDHLRKVMGGWGMNRAAFDDCITDSKDSCSFSDFQKRRSYDKCITAGFRSVYAYWVERNKEVVKRFEPAGFKSSTPTFLLNGELVMARDWEEFKELLEEELHKVY